MNSTIQHIRSIGIPRAMWYHMHPGLWDTFFRNLGFDVKLSGETVRKTVETASLISESEHCLPIKLHDAHLQEIIAEVDTVFIPCVLSTLDDHIACPKLGALPDSVRAQFGDRIDVLTIEIDEQNMGLSQSLRKLGRKLGASGRHIRCATRAAEETMDNVLNRRRDDLTSDCPYFLILGHPYNLYDRYMTEPILRKLDLMDVQWKRVDYSRTEVSPDIIKWGDCSLMYDAINRLDEERCRGVIQLSSFNCGCDSMSTEIYRGVLEKKKIPFMTLVLDENVSQAGVDTRLEAFVDSIGWQHG
ncbi:MAG: acyl-CoA dehydratase activase-related protein [Planctomycetota bacterium]